MNKTRLYKKGLQAPQKGCKLQRKGLQALALLLCLTMVSCRGAKEIVKEVPVYVHDTTYQTLVQHDSTYVDRWHEIVVKGDTVFDTRIEVKYKEYVVHDTSYQVQEVPTIVTQTETIEVKKPLRWWQWLLMGIGVVAILAFVNYVYWSWKLYRK